MADPRQICPACGLLIDDYRSVDDDESLDLFCPHCDDHIAHLEFETMRRLAEGEWPS